MHRYGAEIVIVHCELDTEKRAKRMGGQLFRGPLLRQTVLVALLGAGVGLVMFGFNLWIPSNLQKLGFDEVTADRVLRDSALIGLPFTFLVAWMYGVWSSKMTLVLLTSLTATALLGFAILGESVVTDRNLLQALLVMPIWGINSVTAALSVYSSEIYPTRTRSRGAGFAAGASKIGGVIIISMVASGTAVPSIIGTTLIGGIPMAVAALAFLFFGIETRNRPLEEIVTNE
jgi:putative MFS transporter